MAIISHKCCELQASRLLVLQNITLDKWFFSQCCKCNNTVHTPRARLKKHMRTDFCSSVILMAIFSLNICLLPKIWVMNQKKKKM